MKSLLFAKHMENIILKEITIPFPLSKARNGEHYQLQRDVMSVVTPEFAEAQYLMPFYTPYEQVVSNENYCYLNNLGYMKTEDIATGDKKRDKLFTFIVSTVSTSLRSPIEEVAAAAKRLDFVLKPYKGCNELGYARETAAIADFVEKMKEEANAADAATLGLTEILPMLDEANEAFNTLFKVRAGELNVRTNSQNMRTVRPKVDKAFTRLITAINALYLANELKDKDEAMRTALGTAIDQINSYLTQLQVTLTREGVLSSKDNSAGTEDEDDEPTPTPEPVTPEITAVYQKEGGDPENPNRIERGEQIGVEYQGFTLKGQDGTLEHVIGLVNDQDYIEWIKAATITNVTETSCEFTMVPDLTEGQYKVRIETYDGGSPLVIEYPEPITLW